MVQHKFDEKHQISYRNLMREAFEGQVRLARALEEELGVDESHRIIYKTRVESDLNQVKQQLDEIGKPKNFDEFKRLMHLLHENEFASHLFTITYPVDNEEEALFLTTECIMAEVFKELDAEDLGYLMVCKPDFDTTPAYNGNVNLKRTKCLMLGDDCCDTTYCWKNK
jgi:hypothetical protein